MTGITVALPVIGVYCLVKAYNKSKELSKQNIILEMHEIPVQDAFVSGHTN